MNLFKKPKKVVGRNLVFRNADRADAEFIVQLRTDPVKGKYLSQTSPDVLLQQQWLDKYANDATQVYFIICDRNLQNLGTVRLYDAREGSFCWGSWILSAGRPKGAAVESALMIYRFALALGFTSSHFDVRIGNESVWKFHERMGAVRVSASADDYFYEMPNAAIMAAFETHKVFLPDGVQIEY